MALYVDNLDRVITVDDVPTIYNGVYSDSAEELWAFCQSTHIHRSLVFFKPEVTHNVAYVLKTKRYIVSRFGGTPIAFGETPWIKDDYNWD